MISKMTLFTAMAWAADVDAGGGAAAGSAGSMMGGFLPIILMLVVFYFLLMRPQQKRQKEHQAMLAAIQKGDEIQTSGGLLGKVTGIDTEKNVLTVEIAPQIRVKVGRGFVTRVLTAKPSEVAQPEKDRDKDKEKDKDKDKDKPAKKDGDFR